MKALRDRYPANEYALMYEVRNATGFSGRVRSADAVAMSLWPSRGLNLHGFEFKASKSDWRRELAQPEKAEEICRFMDYWWVVATTNGIVRLDELPENWGLLELRDGKLKCLKKAPKLKPQPLTKEFIASLFREAQRQIIPETEVQKRIDSEVSRVRSELVDLNRASVNMVQERFDKQLAEATDWMDRFEKAAGSNRRMAWRRIQPEDLGKAVAVIMDNGVEQHMQRLEHMKNQVESLGAAVGAAYDACLSYTKGEIDEESTDPLQAGDGESHHGRREDGDEARRREA